eukprot:CAMPEP_0172675198 /NCGR_PEP_ID=MMETSP1074-20121228/13139_1 /TAXON_ID=2916 /ORGANISM="Ceratium fusus, Strain PA161109" /LENGTH=139 /DNA_ID=CAMNT_0013492647 /DNA_START=684 /DNA_END=1103 /DNA_ORIENTATION=+
MTLLIEEVLMPPAAMLACECVCRALRTDQFMLPEPSPAITNERTAAVEPDRKGSHPAVFTTRIVGRTLNASQKVFFQQCPAITLQPASSIKAIRKALRAMLTSKLVVGVARADAHVLLQACSAIMSRLAVAAIGGHEGL